MKKLTFALVGTAALLTVACNRGAEDQVNNAEMNQPSSSDLNALANDAANVANEAQALNAQAQNLQNAAEDNTVNPKDADEQNVSGM
jgi:hypothetical protein